MKSDWLIKAVFWFLIVIGVLVLTGIYWLLVVAIPALITLFAFLYQQRVGKRTLENLAIRPDTELSGELVNKDNASYSGPIISLVELDRYREDHAEIAKTAQVTESVTLPINGGLYAFSTTDSTDHQDVENVVLLACVDFAVVGEVRMIETSEIAEEVLRLGGAVKCILNTKFQADGKVKEIRLHPFQGKWPKKA